MVNYYYDNDNDLILFEGNEPIRLKLALEFANKPLELFNKEKDSKIFSSVYRQIARFSYFL